MLACTLDHLVVTAPSLAAGCSYVEETLGVAMQPGGKHLRMGTHNQLLSLGPSLYLEVIAVDPSIPGPGRPRWFGLDHVNGQPTLSSWVVRTPDIRAALACATEQLGDLMPMDRGDLHWLISVPADGIPPLGGVAPALIEWPVDVHPASGLAERGLRLISLEVFHPDPQRIQRLLTSLNLTGAIRVVACADAAETRLRAVIDTPGGVRGLSIADSAAIQ